MTGIQALLVFASLVWLVLFLSRLRTHGIVRLIAVVAALGAILLVLVPSLSIRLAHLVGVTRGVDLVIYLSFVALGFLWLHLAARQHVLESKLADLVRTRALEKAAQESRPGPTPRREAGGSPADD